MSELVVVLKCLVVEVLREGFYMVKGGERPAEGLGQSSVRKNRKGRKRWAGIRMGGGGGVPGRGMCAIWPSVKTSAVCSFRDSGDGAEQVMLGNG